MNLSVFFLIAIGLAALASARPQGGGYGDGEDYGGQYGAYFGGGGDGEMEGHKTHHPHHAKSQQSFYMKIDGYHVHHGGNEEGGIGGRMNGGHHHTVKMNHHHMNTHEAHPHHAKSHQNVWLKNEHEKKIEIKAHPHYHYGFDVHDSHTHDIKNKHETRDGHKVTGEYSVLEPDHKHIRIVKYTSDKKQGFVAKVIRKKVY